MALSPEDNPKDKPTFYEDHKELIIVSRLFVSWRLGAEVQQWAYENAARFEVNDRHDSAIMAVIDDIMAIKDDPKYTLPSQDNNAHVMDLARRRGEANLAFIRDHPELHAERVRRDVAHLYGFGDLDKGPSLLVIKGRSLIGVRYCKEGERLEEDL